MPYSPAPWPDVVQHLGKYFKLVFLVLVMSLLMDAKWRRRCWGAFTAAMLFTLACTYANIWIDLPWSRTQNQGWGVDHTVFKDYISQGIMMSMFVLIALSQTLNSKLTRQWRLAWGGMALLAALSITHLSYGRTGYVALAAALSAFALFTMKGRSRWLVLAGVGLAAVVVVYSSEGLRGRVAQMVQEARNSNQEDMSSIGQRLYFAEKTWSLIQEKPVLGWGTGAYHEQFCRVATTPAWCEAGKFHPHNQLLFIWVENGLLGLGLLLLLILLPVFSVRDAASLFAVLATGFSGIFLVDSVTHASLWLSTESHFYTLMLALVGLMAYAPSRRV
jgi:O-antigen ligase